MIDLYKEHYFHEFEQKSRLQQAVSTPISLISASLIVSIYILDNANLSYEVIDMIVLCFSVISTIFLVIPGAYYLIKSYTGYEYKHMPYMSNIRKYFDKLEKFYKEEGKSNYKQLAMMEFEQYIESGYISCTSFNSYNNEKKSGFIHKANQFLILGIIVLLICAALVVLSDRFNQ